MAAVLYLVLATQMALVFLSDADSKFGTMPDTCLDGLTKNNPSIDNEDYVGCKSWEDQLSCCTVEQGRFLQENGTRGIRATEPACGEFSPECRKYLVAIGCFYHCEPMLWYYEDDDPAHVPICGDYCDDWFKACEGDKTCMSNWQEGLMLDPASRNCSADTCITFAEMYENGEGLCNTLRGSNFRYEASNKDCMVMMFNGANPNIHGDQYSSANKPCSSLRLYLSLFLFTCYL